MHPKSENANQLDPDAKYTRLFAMGSQSWLGASNANTISHDNLDEYTSNSSSLKQPCNALRTKASKSQANSRQDRGDDANKELQTTVSRHSDGNFKHKQQHLTSIKSPTMVEYLAPPQLELAGHSIGCTLYPYSDPCYEGIMPAYGPHASVNSNAPGADHARMALPAVPLEVTEEPVYVNAKQYHGILRRRKSRAKAELEKKLIRDKKPYLHESRHRHAMRRARGSGGRFVNTKKIDSALLNVTSDKGTGSANWSNSLGSKSAPSNSFGNAGCSSTPIQVKEHYVWDTGFKHSQIPM